MAYAEESYSFKGIPYLDGIDAGNVNKVVLGITYDEKTQKSSRTVAGGTLNTIEDITDVTVAITFTDFATEQLSKGLRGISSDITAGAVTDESVSAPASIVGDPLVETEFMIDLDASVTVTSDPSGTTYTSGTDYEVIAAGIKILSGGSISASDPLLVTYTKEASSIIEALTSSSSTYRFVLDGRNSAQSGKPAVIKVHKLKFAPLDSLDLIGDEFGSFTLNGKALIDTTYNGTTKSQYFVVDKAV